MADGKWITGLEATTGLKEAAQRTLSVRFQIVRDRLAPLIEKPHDDPEDVHQLRVATRRADAALRIFRVCLPGKVYRPARERLRQLRRAGGVVRDWDVFAEELAGRVEQVSAEEGPGLEFLVGYALGQRDAALPGLIETARVHRLTFDEHLEGLLDAVRTPDEETTAPLVLADLARSLLTELAANLEEAATADLTDFASLHPVRIEGKRLRYAMEVFAGCYPASFREKLYPRVEEMQDILGRANDSQVALGRLQALRLRLRRQLPDQWKRLRAGIEGLLSMHQRRLPQERRKFLTWWQRWQKTGRPALFTPP